MDKKPTKVRVIFLSAPFLIIALLGEWLELALGIVMIFGSVVIAIACWYWLGDRGWWFSIPLIAINLAWTGAGVWLVRNPDSILSNWLAHEEGIDNTPNTEQDQKEQRD